jgi:hypothetical protein
MEAEASSRHDRREQLSYLLRVLARAGVLAGAALSTTPASAAIYEVHACRLPSGAPAPANGWSVTTGAIASLNCPGGTMTVRTPGGTIGKGWRYGISFTAPPGTNIAGLRRHVQGEVVPVPGGPPPWYWIYDEAGTLLGGDSPVDIRSWGNVGPFDDSFEYPLPQRLSELLFFLQCDDAEQSGPCQGNGSYFSVSRVSVLLDDYSPPRILGSSGSLLAGVGPQPGQRHLVLNLRDSGSGLYRVRVDVDGERMSELPIDDNDGACRSPFIEPVPCKLAATVDVPIDTTRLSEGTHAITVRVFDATGVNAAAVGPVSIVVDNLPDPPARGTAACPPKSRATVQRRLTRRAVRYGGSALIVGRVSASQTSLKGARVGVVDNPSLAAAPDLAKVRRGGRFTLRLRPRFSTRVQPILLSSTGEAAACGRPLNVRVRAGLRLTVSPRQLRNGQAIRIHGGVARFKLPGQGKTVAIQARARGAASWTTVSLIRSDAAGRFHFSYRFRKTFNRTTYEFRAVAPRERGYPFMRGWSSVRRATVSP